VNSSTSLPADLTVSRYSRLYIVYRLGSARTRQPARSDSAALYLVKVAILVGIAIGLAAAGGWAAEMPNAMPVAESARVGGPIPITPAPAPTSAAAPLVSPVYPSVPASRAYPTRYPVTVFDPYHPHWIIEVFGR
jgi:hypothetical protein